MALTRQQKQKIIEKLRDDITQQRIMIFVDFKGLKVKDLFKVRERLKKVNSRFFVTKKTLMKLVFKEKNIKVEEERLEGQPAIIFGFKDEISPAKVTFQFSQENKNLKILGGYFENEFKKAEDIVFLAKLSSREELLGKLVGTLSAPISGFMNVLQGNMRKLVYVLSQIKVNQ